MYDRLYGRPLDDAYPSSDTDASEGYTTEQESASQVEARMMDAIAHGGGACPWPKMRRAAKDLKRSRRGEELDRKSEQEDLAFQLEVPRTMAQAKEQIRRLTDRVIRYKQRINTLELDPEARGRNPDPGTRKMQNEDVVLDRHRRKKDRMKEGEPPPPPSPTTGLPLLNLS